MLGQGLGVADSGFTAVFWWDTMADAVAELLESVGLGGLPLDATVRLDSHC
jgi:hypothetical protein